MMKRGVDALMMMTKKMTVIQTPDLFPPARKFILSRSKQTKVYTTHPRLRQATLSMAWMNTRMRTQEGITAIREWSPFTQLHSSWDIILIIV